jgi:Cu2+-containing amine oxidase
MAIKNGFKLPSHPLDPLTAPEVAQVSAVVRDHFFNKAQIKVIKVETKLRSLGI